MLNSKKKNEYLLFKYFNINKKQQTEWWKYYILKIRSGDFFLREDGFHL